MQERGKVGDMASIPTSCESRYYSQDVETCGEDRLDYACAAVSLANSLLIANTSARASPREIMNLDPTAMRTKGTSPEELVSLARRVLDGDAQWAVRLRHPCTTTELTPGSLLYVDCIALKNAQGRCQYESADVNSHVVVVERISDDALVVINPDIALRIRPRRKKQAKHRANATVATATTATTATTVQSNGLCAADLVPSKPCDCFVYDTCGRMRIPLAKLDSVWQSVRFDGTQTKRAAVVIQRHSVAQS